MMLAKFNGMLKTTHNSSVTTAETSNGTKVLRTSPRRRNVSHNNIAIDNNDSAAACSNALMIVLAECSTEIGPPIALGSAFWTALENAASILSSLCSIPVGDLG